METCDVQNQGGHTGEERHSDDDDESTRNNQLATSRGTRAPKPVQNYIKIVSFLKKISICPLDAAFSTQMFLTHDDFRGLFQKRDKVCELALLTLKTELVEMKIRDYITMYSDKNCNPLFDAKTYEEAKRKYLSIPESIKCILTVLSQQCTEFSIDQIINILYQWTNRESGKKNTIYIIGEPSAGKNWVFDSLSSFFLNIGHLSNPGRGCNFPFQNAIDRRLLVWNEIKLAEDFYEVALDIMGGTTTSVKVKYNAD